MKISVVIPCYNYATFVRDAIESVQSGRRAPDEIIVVDDGSTDESLDVVRSVPGVLSIPKPNGGMASALNRGIAASTGDVVVFLDADDMAGPMRLEWIEEAFGDSSVSMAWHPLEITDPNGRVRGLLPHGPMSGGHVAERLASSGLDNFAVTSGLAARRTALTAVGPIPEDDFRNNAEAFLVRTLPFVGIVAATDRALGMYRVHSGSDSRHLVDLSTATVAAKLQRRLSQVDVEHDLLHRSAVAAGFSCDVGRLRASDSIYLELAIACARLSSPTRRRTVREVRQLSASCTWTSGSRLRFVLKAVQYVLLPRRVVAVIFIVRLGEVTTPAWLRWTAKTYWRMVGIRDKLRSSLRRATTPIGSR